MIQNKIKGIIFDYDDTLVATISSKWTILKQVGKEYGLKINNDDIKVHWGKPFKEQIQGIFGSIDDLETLIEKNIQAARSNYSFFHTGNIEILKKLKKKYYLSILSSGSKDIIIPEILFNRVDYNLFFNIQTSQDTDIHKPDPLVFVPTICKYKSIGVDSTELIYVGDSLNDYLASTQAGIRFIAITSGLTSEKEFHKVDRNIIVINTLSDIFKHLLQN